MTTTTNKKITLALVGLDGNAFALMGAFRRQARKEGWMGQEIDDVLNEAMNGDYNHLLATLISHCQDSIDCKDDDN